MNADVLAVGLNPAWQLTLDFAEFEYGQVNRAGAVAESVGGKAVNAARAVKTLVGKARILQFLGGYTGEQIRRELTAAGMPFDAVETAVRTRICTTVLNRADGSMTELIEPAGPVRAEEVRALKQTAFSLFPTVPVVAFCGTWPDGVTGRDMAELVRAARRSGLVIWDAWRGAEPALEAAPDWVKINAEELGRLVGRADVPAAISAFFEHWPVRVLGVTDGPRPAWLATRTAVWRFHTPPLEKVRNPLGAGDCATAVLALRAARHSRPGFTLETDEEFLVSVFSEALACAMASCTTALPAEFDPGYAASLQAAVRVEPIH